MAIKSMHDLLVDSVKDIYYAEKQVLKTMPRMIKKISSNNVKKAFEQHSKETEKQIARLEKVFKELNMTPKAKKCPAIDGIIQEGKEVMDEISDPNVMDAAVIGFAQKIEHYEITSYGTARTFANHLGMNKLASLLQNTLDEEYATDDKLTQMAQSEVNVEAVEASA
ncbi:MAG: ferritin-like domain-containing protein [Ignavibacteria bacterium]|jgi:ferritin-like metal-binding protein YciE|nr:ferritin-like domain-containing protein [Ignavibacteria bacterium]MCU7503586.1 ferritin-like domain-containing protein [Ignavibacteria bacterium]MCU7516760.1 ferritin-like domain-containing protein [Ignavibacteria bacterium]